MALTGAVLVATVWAGPHVHFGIGRNAWLLLLIGWAGLVGVALVLSRHVRHPTGLVIIVTTAALMRLVALAQPPYLSTDVFRYVWDGRVQAAGINPYRYVPAAPELAPLRDAAIYPNINRADYAPTIYPPVAQMIFRLTHVFGDTERTMRVAMIAFEALAVGSMMGILRAMALPVERVVAYAWHPLPVLEIAGNGHVDAAMLGLMLAGVWVYLRGRLLPGGALIALAAFVKPTALLAMPVLWRRWDWKLPALLVAIAVGVYAPYLSAGRAVFGFLGGYVAEEGLAAGVGFWYVGIVEQLAGPVRGIAAAYVLLAAAILGGLALQAGFRADRSATASIRILGTLLVAFMVLLTPHYPWYYLVLVPLLAFGHGVTPWVLTIGGFGLYNEIDSGAWPLFEWRLGALHIAGLAALLYDAWRARLFPAKPILSTEVRP